MLDIDDYIKCRVDKISKVGTEAECVKYADDPTEVETEKEKV